jgi:hypothetical protein
MRANGNAEAAGRQSCSWHSNPSPKSSSNSLNDSGQRFSAKLFYKHVKHCTTTTTIGDGHERRASRKNTRGSSCYCQSKEAKIKETATKKKIACLSDICPTSTSFFIPKTIF